ncbi:hypothetical protein ABZ814_13505 [Micromonospora musae]|uniref:hypothetical protein n=1 Tax=Micromonospora musae TaxID=1894970 RepID=UPI0033FC4807
MAYPDIVALLRTYLLPIVDPVGVVGRVPDPRPARLVQLRRVGGTQLRPVRDQPRVDAICWDATDPAAVALADTVRRAVHALAGTTLLGPTVYRVDETLGPMSIDDPLTGSPRVMATYSIAVRADEAISR